MGDTKGPFIGAFAILNLPVINQTKKTHVLKLHLKTGQIVICDFNSGFIAPEMVKARPVVVISKSSTHWRELCTVLPFSTSAPTKPEKWHVLIENPLANKLPPSYKFAQAPQVWVKCDMICTVAFHRLTRPHARSHRERAYENIRLPQKDLADVFEGMRAYLPDKT